MKCELLDVPPEASFSPSQWGRGMQVEYEHTKDPICAAAIAAHHLLEHPRYYEELEKMEQRLGVEGYRPNSAIGEVWAVAAVASSGASAYHGYKRNQSVGWAIVWGAAGALFPVITPAIAVAQGFGQPKGG